MKKTTQHRQYLLIGGGLLFSTLIGGCGSDYPVDLGKSPSPQFISQSERNTWIDNAGKEKKQLTWQDRIGDIIQQIAISDKETVFIVSESLPLEHIAYSGDPSDQLDPKQNTFSVVHIAHRSDGFFTNPFGLVFSTDSKGSDSQALAIFVGPTKGERLVPAMIKPVLSPEHAASVGLEPITIEATALSPDHRCRDSHLHGRGETLRGDYEFTIRNTVENQIIETFVQTIVILCRP